MAFDDALATRVRNALPGGESVIEKWMFGGFAFLLNGNMCCGVQAAAIAGLVLAAASLGSRADLATVLIGLVAAVSLVGLAAWLVSARGRSNGKVTPGDGEPS